MGRWQDLFERWDGAIVVVVTVDMWAVLSPSTYPQLSAGTLTNRWENLTEFTEKNLHYPLKFRGLSANYRKEVMELPLTNIKGCHYEIGLHKDCHEIALHFQGSAENNKFRSESFKPFKQQIESALGFSVIIGPHERTGVRKRLWVSLPLAPLTSDLENEYSEIAFNLIASTLPILQSIIEKESIAKNRE